MCSNLLTFVIFLITIIDAKIMVWTPNQNFENPNNWLPARLPCSNDKVIYPRELKSVVKITKKNISVKEVDLPAFGSIELNSGGSLELSDKSKDVKDCPGGDIKFNEKIVHSWMDVHSWMNFEAINNRGSEAIPHYDRLPCIQDVVIFPSDNSISVKLPQTTVQVKSILFENQKLSSNRWQEILKERPNVFQAAINGDIPAVDIVSDMDECTSNFICHCHLRDMPDELCANEAAKCPPIKCLHSIRPKNHCCDICGSVLRIKVDENFNYYRFKTMVENAIDDYDVEDVDYYIGPILEKLADQYIQIVIVEKNEYDERSVKLGEYIQDIINRDHNFTNKMNILEAGRPWGSSAGSSGGWTAFLMLLIIGLLFTGVIMYYYPPAFIINVNPFRPYDFARFNNRSREGSLVLGVSQMSLDKSFVNPLYNKTETVFEEEELDENDGNLTETEALDDLENEK